VLRSIRSLEILGFKVTFHPHLGFALPIKLRALILMTITGKNLSDSLEYHADVNIVIPHTKMSRVPCVVYRKDANIVVSRFVIARFYCSVMVGPRECHKASSCI
jgi:hypothetical protein